MASGGYLEVFNLCSAAVQAGLVFEAPITCVSYYATCAFVYVGLKNGDIHVVNVDGWAKSLYKIQAKDCQIPPTVNDLSVVAVAINPDRDDIILLGFGCGAINEWEIKTCKVVRRYLSDKPLTALCWDPSGNKFMAGHSNGEVVVWTRKKSIADEIYHPMVNPQRPNAVKRLFWLAQKPSSSETTVVTLGGTDFPNGIVIDHLKQKKRNFVPLSPKGVELRDIKIVYSSPSSQLSSSGSSTSTPSKNDSSSSSSSNSSPQTPEPIAVIAVNARGNISVHALSSDYDERALLPSVNAPLPFSLDHSVSVLASIVIQDDSNGFLRDLISAGNIDPTDALKGQTSSLNWPLSGGSFVLDQKSPPTILITLMSNNSVIFWDLSMRNCKVPIYRIRLPGVVSPKTNLVFDFCASSRILHVGNDHDVFVYHFCCDSRSVQLMTIDDTAGAPQISSAPVPSAAVKTVATASPSKRDLNSKKGSSSALASSGGSAGSGKQNNISSNGAPDAASQNSGAQTQEGAEDASSALDEAPPTPPTPVRREGHSQQNSSSDSASQALPSTPSKPQLNASDSPLPQSPQSTPQQSSQGSSQETSALEKSSSSNSSASSALSPSSPPLGNSTASLGASAASLNSSTSSRVTQAPPRVSMTPLPTQPAGFQFVASIALSGKSIQTIKYESGLNLLAVSTGDGCVRVYNSAEEYAPIYAYFPPANTMPCPPIVTHIQFAEASLGTQERPEDHLLLIMGLDMGSVQSVSLTKPSKAFKPISARKSPVVDIRVVAHRGDHLYLSKRIWSREVEPSFVPTPQQSNYQPSYAIPKNLVVCTVNDVRAYKIPEFEMISQYDCPAPIAWYGTIQVLVDVQGVMEREYVLGAIDMASNVLYIRLMNLTLVSYAGPNNLSKLGVEGVSPMATPKSCNLLDGTIIVHTDTSETYIVKILPFEEKRAVTKLLGPEPPKPIAKKSKGLKGLIGKDKDVDFEAVFGPRKDIAPPASSSSSSASATSPNAPPKPTETSKRTSEVTSVMHQNLEMLNQRGEKLSDLAQRTEDMRESSSSFAALAKKLAAQQEKSWF